MCKPKPNAPSVTVQLNKPADWRLLRNAISELERQLRGMHNRHTGSSCYVGKLHYVEGRCDQDRMTIELWFRSYANDNWSFAILPVACGHLHCDERYTEVRLVSLSTHCDEDDTACREDVALTLKEIASLFMPESHAA